MYFETNHSINLSRPGQEVQPASHWSKKCVGNVARAACRQLAVRNTSSPGQPLPIQHTHGPELPCPTYCGCAHCNMPQHEMQRTRSRDVRNNGHQKVEQVDAACAAGKYWILLRVHIQGAGSGPQISDAGLQVSGLYGRWVEGQK